MNIFDLQARIGLDTSEYETGLDKSKSKLASIGGAIKGGLSAAAKVSAVAIGAASAATVAFGKSAVDAGMSFDSSMSQVAATMGKTVDEIQDLRDYALEMGSKTAFSASQAADALNYMALAGYDSEKSMSMLPNVLNLAAAGGIELASASDMVTDAQSALGLSMAETTDLVDKMAMASSKSNTSVAQLGEAILTVGGTAKVLAGGTTELSTALGILADNGVKGAEGGTALRNIILSLSAPTDNASKYMKSLGLQVFDAEGNMRPLNDTLNDLNGILANMNQGEQTQALNKIFNKVDLKSVNALLANSGERFDELSGYIDEATGSAEKMANTQLDNLAGDITLFNSALEGAQIALSDGLTPSLRELVQFGTEGVTRLTEAFNADGFSGVLDEIMEMFGELGGKIKSAIEESGPKVAEAIPSVISKIVETIEARVDMVTDTAPVIIDALVTGIKENMPKVADIAISIINSISNFISEDLGTLLDASTDIIITLVDGLSQALPRLLPAAVSIVLELVEKITEPDRISDLVSAALTLITSLGDGVIKALPALLEKAPVIVENLVKAIMDNTPVILDCAWKLIKSLTNGILANLPQILQSGKDIIDSLGTGIVSVMGSLDAILDEISATLKLGFHEAIDSALQWGRDLLDNFIGGILGKISALKDTVSGVAQTVKDFLGFSEPEKGPLSNFHTYAPDMMDLFTEGIKNNQTKLKKQVSDTASMIKDGFSDVSSVNISADISERNNSNAFGSKANGFYNGGNVYNITVAAGTIANDYDARRAAQMMSEALADLQSMQASAVGA